MRRRSPPASRSATVNSPSCGRQAVARRGAAQADAGDAERRERDAERVLGEERLMGAMERAETEVDDADRQPGAIVAWSPDLARQPVEVRRRQPQRHAPAPRA